MLMYVLRLVNYFGKTNLSIFFKQQEKAYLDIEFKSGRLETLLSVELKELLGFHCIF